MSSCWQYCIFITGTKDLSTTKGSKLSLLKLIGNITTQLVLTDLWLPLSSDHNHVYEKEIN